MWPQHEGWWRSRDCTPLLYYKGLHSSFFGLTRDVARYNPRLGVALVITGVGLILTRPKASEVHPPRPPRSPATGAEDAVRF